MITLYSFPASRSLRVAWTLEELGLEYECRHVDLGGGEGQTEAFLARHPDGKVPVLVDGGLTLFESAAICPEKTRSTLSLPAKGSMTVRTICAENGSLTDASGKNHASAPGAMPRTP